MTNKLRALIDTRLNDLKTSLGIKEVGYRRASDQKMFPHVVWEILSASPMDMGREDYIIDFDVWGKSEAKVFEIMDAIRHDLEFLNSPTNDILPTFYDVSMGTVDDPDQTLVHGVIRVHCQVYSTAVSDRNLIFRPEPEPETASTASTE